MRKVSYSGCTSMRRYHTQFSCPGDLVASTGDWWFVACLSSALDGVKGSNIHAPACAFPFPGKVFLAPSEWKAGLGPVSRLDALEKE